MCLAALFLWIKPFVTNLSIIDIASLKLELDCSLFLSARDFKTFFQYKDKDTLLDNYCSLIETDHEDNVVQVRFNNRTEIIPYDNIKRINRYTDARREFWKLIKSKSNNIVIKQKPGDMIIMDNYRVLHGRAKYKDVDNQRYFRQGYLDRDILQSKLKIMREIVT